MTNPTQLIEHALQALKAVRPADSLSDSRLRLANSSLNKARAHLEQPTEPARTVCAYPECKCPTENPCLQGLPAPSTAGERAKVVEDLLMYAGDNGYSHIDYADTMLHAAALLQSTALPVGELTLPSKRDIGEFDPKKSGSTFFRGLGWNEAIDEVAGLFAAARSQPVREPL